MNVKGPLPKDEAIRLGIPYVAEEKIGRRVRISVTPEAQAALNRVQKSLAETLGFQPTLHQTVLWLVRDYESRKDETQSG